jgi:hypothetical protein
MLVFCSSIFGAFIWYKERWRFCPNEVTYVYRMWVYNILHVELIFCDVYVFNKHIALNRYDARTNSQQNLTQYGPPGFITQAIPMAVGMQTMHGTLIQIISSFLLL